MTQLTSLRFLPWRYYASTSPRGSSCMWFVCVFVLRSTTQCLFLLFLLRVRVCVVAVLWWLFCVSAFVCLVALLFDCLFTRRCRSHHGAQAGYSPQGLSYY